MELPAVWFKVSLDVGFKLFSRDFSKVQFFNSSCRFTETSDYLKKLCFEKGQFGEIDDPPKNLIFSNSTQYRSEKSEHSMNRLDFFLSFDSFLFVWCDMLRKDSGKKFESNLVLGELISGFSQTSTEKTTSFVPAVLIAVQV